jgi:hypothetical protein
MSFETVTEPGDRSRSSSCLTTTERPESPTELALLVGGVLQTVAYHVRLLAKAELSALIAPNPTTGRSSTSTASLRSAPEL